VAGRQDVGQHEGFGVAHAVANVEHGVVRVQHADELGLGAVDFVAEDPAAALQALPVAGLAAVLAGSARADAGDEDPVAGGESAHAVAGLPDGPDGLVAQDPAVVHRRHVALKDVQVGPADGGRVNPHDDIAIVEDLRVRYFFPGLLPGTVVDEGSHGFLRWLVVFHYQSRQQGRLTAGSKVHSVRVEGHRPRPRRLRLGHG